MYFLSAQSLKDPVQEFIPIKYVVPLILNKFLQFDVVSYFVYTDDVEEWRDVPFYIYKVTTGVI